MAVAFDARTELSGEGSTASGNHTASGSDRIVFALITCEDAPSTPTYGGANMTLLQADTVGGYTAVWYRIAPASGSQAFSAGLGGIEGWQVKLISFTGADQTTGINGEQNSTTNTTTPSVTVTSQAGDMVVGFLAYQRGAATTVTVGAGQDERSDTWAGNIGHCISTEPGAASVVTNYTISASPNQTQLTGINIIAAGGGGGSSVATRAFHLSRMRKS